ncbi:MAG: hypothetical protein J6Y53_00530 [Alphaproteobacteria bacterium]|nr:hypothetical protein [Alphaproteobacteria bacterium]
MDFFGKYQSPFGYQNGDNGIDSYGVDHSGFSTQDELQYQNLRLSRENELANDMVRQGIAESNYPQYGTGFWGNNLSNGTNYDISRLSPTVQNALNLAIKFPPEIQQPQEQQNNTGILNSVQNYAENVVNAVAPYTPTYYVGYGIGTTQNYLSDVYNLYKKDGVYSVGKNYAKPSVQKALQAKDEVAPLDISDVNKHQYVSCIGATDGLLATAETLAGGLYKEMQDTKDKIADPQKRVAYGGILGVLGDAKKDLKNDFIGATAGYIAGRYNVPETCNLLLSNPIKFEK